MFYHISVDLNARLRNFVEPEHVLAALNVPPLSANQAVDFKEEYAAADCRLPRAKLRPLIAGLLSAKLRRYVDPWLDTGISKDGTEEPSRRTLRDMPYMAVQLYMEKYPPYVGLYERGLEVRLGETLGLPNAPEQLLESIELNAQRLFTGLIASDWNGRFGKCRHPACGRYFVRTKLRRTYKRGLFCCREHQALASATVCTKKSRTAAHHGLIALAAKQLMERGVKNDQWKTDGRAKRRLAQAVSKCITKSPTLRVNRQRVQLNWITRHGKEIEHVRAGQGKPNH
jgi:hypothetical protein